MRAAAITGYTTRMHASPPDQSSGTGVTTDASRAALDVHVRDVIAWHFDPASGCPFWLDFAKKAGWDPRREIGGFADLKRFGQFDDEAPRGGPGGCRVSKR